ncbi:proteasome assembly chaperone family protein [Natronomonas sp. EA1]|uniref:proteasome assembly chaperone family protein n=1 Tax=Natronomonas sp. EA1 TaxID=3421655 RepID=UPI003EB7524E
MAHVQVYRDDIELESPTLIEGLPGAGLVGKIAADHIVEQFDMAYYGAVFCDGLPQVAVYHGDGHDTMPPVRLYADAERDLLVLQSDVPVSPNSADQFAGCITGWLQEHDVFPLYLSGLPTEKDGVPEVYGIAAGDTADRLEAAGITHPHEGGLVSGPTGALLHRATEIGFDAVGLIVETEAQFPDPESARSLIAHGIEPLTDIEVDTDELVERAEEIRQAKEQLATRLHESENESSSEAKPIRGFQ